MDHLIRGDRACVLTNGCPENRIDSARMQEYLKLNGWTITADWQEADVILFNACALTQRAEERSIYLVKKIQAEKGASTELIVCGCLPKINEGRLREVCDGFTFGHDIGRVSHVLGTRTEHDGVQANYLLPQMEIPPADKCRIPHFKSMASLQTMIELLLKPYTHHRERTVNVFHPNSFCIKVSSGCLGNCSFCAVKISRGTVRSKSVGQVVDEFRQGLANGYREFALLGTDLGAYGRDQGTTLAALLRALVKEKGDFDIRLRNVQPRFLIEMMPELRDIFQSGRVSYLSSAAQSGNNRILELMNRGYTAEGYKRAILTLKREFPEVQIRTQFMVGFPTETEQEFRDTLNLLDEVRFDFVEVYVFQPRPGTRAATMEGQVPVPVARRRQYKLLMRSLFRTP